MNTTLQLTFDEKNILESLYGRQVGGTEGYNPRMLEDIVELTAHEKKFFAGKNFVSPHFFVQTLYKVRGKLNPLKFSTAVNRTINDNKNLRGNFCNVGARTLKVIQPAHLFKPEVIFRNLTLIDPAELDDEFRKIMEADMRRDFDLRHDPLIRFAVYRTSDEEFAVLLTAAQLIVDNFDAEKFFADLTGTTSDKPQSQSDDLPPQNQEAIRNYWAKVLDKAPPPATLPYETKSTGAYRQKAFRKKIPADILSDLRGRAQSNRMMLTAILQSAWGFMLQLTNKRRDSLFCQILSASDSLNVIPVRVTGDKTSTVEQIVSKQFRQLVISQPYSRIDRSDLENLFGRDKKLFNHFLSFKEFKSSELNYLDTPAEECGKIISRNSWDAQGMKLGVYFRYSKKILSVSFLYDERQFQRDGIERLCALYEIVLKQMLVDWNAKYTDFVARLDNRINLQLEQAPVARLDDKKRIRDFLAQLPILQGRFAGTISLFDSYAELVTLYEGDRISGDMLEKNFIFVVEGKLSRNVDTGDGWYMPLDIVKRNGFVNPANLLSKQRLTLSAEVLTERIELLTIPHDVMLDTLRKNTDLSLTMMTFALEQMERWQLLWLQS